MKWLSNITSKFKKEPKYSIDASDMQLMREVAREASKWIGVHEVRGKPTSDVNIFRKATDGVACGEPWCAAFVQYCVASVSRRYNKEISLYPSECCHTIWKNTPKQCRLSEPLPGCIVIWNIPGTTQGHTGIFLKRHGDTHIKTIEGNTKDPREGSDKSIRGVYPKLRSLKGDGNLVILGYLNPFV